MMSPFLVGFSLSEVGLLKRTVCFTIMLNTDWKNERDLETKSLPKNILGIGCFMVPTAAQQLRKEYMSE